MRKTLLTTLAIASSLFVCREASAQYYKDLFIDGGCYLNSRPYLPSANLLDLSVESFWCGNAKAGRKTVYTEADSLAQYEKMIGSKDDTNGCLLYPDGAPRFKVIYVNGGNSAFHGRSLGIEGGRRIIDFFNNGGSYIGTCAGAFLSSKGGTDYWKTLGKCNPKQDGIHREFFLGIYPKSVLRTRKLTKEHWGGDVYTGLKVEPGCSLLKYYDFGGDMYIDSVRHNGGCFITENEEHFAPGTEIMMRYDFDKDDIRIKEKNFPITDHIAVWAWKKDESTGRIVNCGSHPEGVTKGERLDLFAAFLRYALDGLGAPRVKGELKKGKVRVMDKKTEDNKPEFTVIGDKQYHHFIVNIPKTARNFEVSLECRARGIDMNLMLNKGDFAFRSNAEYQDVSLGGSKSIKLERMEKGTWYISVECATTVTEEKCSTGIKYTGRTEVLNGVPYSIKVNWK